MPFTKARPSQYCTAGPPESPFVRIKNLSQCKSWRRKQSAFSLISGGQLVRECYSPGKNLCRPREVQHIISISIGLSSRTLLPSPSRGDVDSRRLLQRARSRIGVLLGRLQMTESSLKRPFIRRGTLLLSGGIGCSGGIVSSPFQMNHVPVFVHNRESTNGRTDALTPSGHCHVPTGFR